MTATKRIYTLYSPLLLSPLLDFSGLFELTQRGHFNLGHEDGTVLIPSGPAPDCPLRQKAKFADDLRIVGSAHSANAFIKRARFFCSGVQRILLCRKFYFHPLDDKFY
ncbi:hypothetical protein TNIN_335001 [Trichonephila inaurata madagascariensis]|uniref:Uncharacterized protein n=1 Tax=Trichonephila inaurata madagascariensis TaxID=2747483 RepID=A0A8X6Y4T2_9ARAC|nr:hypothetical protein TNIN_335001 [Trichonephila inaurata madagascariensis]